MANVKDLNDSKTEALQALFNSLSNPSDSINGKLSQEQLHKLSSQVNEILGGKDGEDGANRGTSQLVNEDGLPIVDITEPAGQSVSTELLQDGTITDGPDLVPIQSLSLEERERRRIERERLLDLLEEEERAEQAREEAEEEERQRKAIEKRKENAKAEIDLLKATKEMHKRMGKALLKNVAEAREKEEAAKRKLLEEEEVLKQQNRSIKPKKSVTFAEGTEEEDGGTKLERGDVAPARLQYSSRLWDKSADQSSTMKRHVIERFPGQPSTPIELNRDVDSDDESPVEEPPDSNEEEDSEGEDPEIDSEDDWDSAQHQREVALEYYEKRHAVGSEAARAMSSHTHDDEWDQPEVPLEATLAGRPKPEVSRFKTERSAFGPAKSESNPATPTAASTSIGFATIPASGQNVVRKTVKMGSLEGDQLVGGSDSEPEDETATEILDMLKKGQIENAGPDFVPATFARTSTTSTLRGRPSPLPLAKGKSKDQDHLDVDLLTPVPQTPVNHIIRSSPKVSTFDLPTSVASSHDHFPVLSAGPSSRVQPARLMTGDSLLVPNNPQFSDSIDAYSPCLSSASTAVDSPVEGEESHSVFPWNNPPASPSTPSGPPIVVSSSVQDSSSSRPSQPPIVMSSTVQESSRRSDTEPQPSGDRPRKRVSKFKAERT